MAYWVCAGCGEAYDDRKQADHLRSPEHRQAIRLAKERRAQKATQEAPWKSSRPS